ncbi:MAG TPA: glycosyltransferase, partial [Planctomycetota bacterium]|nr:glycosyltransferase [Planctomycetota bacterium]
EVHLIRNARNEGYSRGNNVGIRAARGRHVLLLNSDTEPAPRALRALVRFLDESPSYGAVGARLWNPDGTLQRACMRFPTLATALLYDSPLGRRFPGNPVERRHFYRDFDHVDSRDVDQPPGAALALRRAALDQVGLLDEEMFLFFNDVDLCKRLLAAGWRIRYLADANVVHHVGASTSRYPAFAAEYFRNKIAYFRKHHGALGESVFRAITRFRAREEKAKLRATMKPSPELEASLAGVDHALSTALRRDAGGRGVIAELGATSERLN